MEELKEGWRKVKLGEIANLKYGKMPKKDKIKENGYPIFSGYRITGYYDEYMLEEEEIIVVARGVGGTGDVKISPPKSFITNLSIILLLKNDINKKFLYYLLKNKNLRILDSGSAQSQITINDLKEYEVFLPNLKSQDKIASILSSLDEKIELNRKINQNLEETAQTLFKRWFIDFEFPNEEGKPYKSSGGKMIESELGEIPEGWRSFSLKDIVKQIKPGTNFQPKRLDKGIPFLNIKNIVNSEIDLNDVKYISEVDYEKVHKTWKPQEKDILISRIGTLGLVTILKKNKLPIAVHYNFLVIKAKKISSYFLYFLLKSQEFQKKYDSIKKQSVQEYVTVEDVEEIKVVLPENLEILYEKYFISFYKEIIKNQDEIYKLKELRDYLLPKLMSGEISV